MSNMNGTRKNGWKNSKDSGHPDEARDLKDAKDLKDSNDLHDLDADAAENGSIITLTGDDGSTLSFELLDMINYSGTDYAVLAPAEESDEHADEVEIFRVENGDKDVNTLVPVANPETAQAIFDLFRTKNAGKFDFE